MHRASALWVASGLLLVSACAPAAAPAQTRTPPSTPETAATAPGGAAPPASGDPTQSSRLSGVVKEHRADQVTLEDGQTFTLTAATRLLRSRPGTIADFQPGEYVAVTARRQPDDTLLASMVNVFAATQSQFGQFQRPMGDGNLMTNAILQQVEGQRLTVTFPGGTDQVALAPDAQIRVITDATADDIQPGSALSAQVSGGVAQFVSFQ